MTVHKDRLILNYMGVSKNRGKNSKMDGENNGSKPYEQMDDFGGFTTPIFGSTPICLSTIIINEQIDWTHIHHSHHLAFFQV